MPIELKIAISFLVIGCAAALWAFIVGRVSDEVAASDAPIKPRAHETIEELSTTPALNNPPGWESMNHWDEHARALYAMVAQLRDRIEELERR